MSTTVASHSALLLAPVLSVVKKTCLESRHTDTCWVLNFANRINFRSVEVVDRGSETQLQLTENLN